MPEDIEKLKRLIGLETDDNRLITEAVTHRSYAGEYQLTYNNQRLEFLGDAVLEIILSEAIYRARPDADEGAMSKHRSMLACESTLAAVSRELDLGSYLLLGRGESASGGADRESILADLFEAVVGVLYLSKGLDAARDFVLGRLGERISDPGIAAAAFNPKGELQELAQKHCIPRPEYRLTSVSGPGHAQTFTVEASCGGLTAAGSGKSRRRAEEEAASMLFKLLSAKFENL